MTTDSGTLPGALDAGHLTGVLRRAGAIGDGRVRDVVVVSDRSNILSRTIRLSLTYDGAPDGSVALILKTAHPGRSVEGPSEAAKREVEFYTRVAPCMAKALVPRCFAASVDDGASGFTTLLEDLSDSHLVATEWPLPPTVNQCERIVRAWARLRAAWWDDPRLGVTVGTRPDAVALDRYAQRFAGEFARFDGRLGDRVTPQQRVFFERLVKVMPRLLRERLASPEATIVHGNAHV